ncbi:MAG: hypothetical protein ACOY3M_00420 [Patescibacteria group bacterium]
MNHDINYFIYCSPHQSFSKQESDLITFAEKEELNVVGIYFGTFRSMLFRIQKSEAQGVIVSDITDLPITPLFTSLISKNLIRDIKYLTQSK